MANYPSFDPNDRRKMTGEQLRNWAMTDVFEPGSTMKPITVATALQLGRITPQTVIDTNPGRITVAGATIHDDENFGVLTTETVIQKSSNVGATKISQRMTPKEMWDSYTSLGFGQKPQTQFPGAVTGRLRPWKSWRPIEQATMSYGYGLSASLFQIAHAYTAFANGGKVIPITMLKTHEPPVGVPVFSELVAAQVRKMMHMAAAAGGTAPLAQTEGYSVGGKTGTAHKQVGKGYASNKYRAWYTGMSPIDKPRIIVAVMIDEPSAGKYFGGLVAAPVFQRRGAADAADPQRAARSSGGVAGALSHHCSPKRPCRKATKLDTLPGTSLGEGTRRGSPARPAHGRPALRSPGPTPANRSPRSAASARCPGRRARRPARPTRCSSAVGPTPAP